MSTETADVLQGAADILRRNGWHQGDYFDRDQLDGGRGPDDCAVCLHGAINLAAAGNPENDYHHNSVKATNTLVDWLWTSLDPDIYASLSAWNDADGRTADEVIAALEGAAAAERDRAA